MAVTGQARSAAGLFACVGSATLCEGCHDTEHLEPRSGRYSLAQRFTWIIHEQKEVHEKKKFDGVILNEPPLVLRRRSEGPMFFAVGLEDNIVKRKVPRLEPHACVERKPRSTLTCAVLVRDQWPKLSYSP